MGSTMGCSLLRQRNRGTSYPTRLHVIHMNDAIVFWEPRQLLRTLFKARDVLVVHAVTHSMRIEPRFPGVCQIQRNPSSAFSASSNIDSAAICKVISKFLLSVCLLVLAYS